MTRALHRERTARKPYRCGFECGELIEPGTRYVRSAIPPGSDPNYSDEWWTHALHGHSYQDCPARNATADTTS